MRLRLSAAIALAVLWLCAGLYFADCGSDSGDAAGQRPAAWATPLRRPGLPNLHKVSADLYRGAQPTAEGMRELKKMGIRTVVSLRTFEADLVLLGDTGLGHEAIPMSAWSPQTGHAVAFLKIATDRAKTPVFVHCLHGADRTGLMCAIYRVVVQGWDKEEGIREMTSGGFGHHAIFRNLTRFIRELDVEAIKNQAGMTK